MTGRHRAPARPYRLVALMAVGGILAALHLGHAQAETVVAPVVPVKPAVLTQPAAKSRPVVRTVMAAAKVTPSKAEAAVAAALSKIGAPYIWGVKGPTAFDCSGLTQWAYKQVGIELPQDTYGQVARGVPVAPGDVREGDLIFASFNARGPGHVLLAISHSQVVEAPGRGMSVRVAPMPAQFQARRVV